MGKNFGCGDSDCGASTGICGSMTFGKGNLDYYGYWEFPCKVCEKAWKDLNEKPFFSSPVSIFKISKNHNRLLINKETNKPTYCYLKKYWGDLEINEEYVIEYFLKSQKDTKKIKMKIYETEDVYWSFGDGKWGVFFDIIRKSLFNELKKFCNYGINIDVHYRIREA